METNTPTAKKSQGDKVAETFNNEDKKFEKKLGETILKEERNPSSTYTIKSLMGVIKKLDKLKMCKPEEIQELKKIHKNVVERWIGLEIQ